MVKELHKVLNIFVIIAIIFTSSETFASTKEKKYVSRIISLSHSGESGKLKELARKFFKQYPKSNYVADVRLILAENESNPKESIKQYRTLVDKYKFFKKRDYAQYKLCETLYLLSQWKTLKNESRRGIKLFKRSRYFTKFRFFLARAYIHLEMFEDAKDVCLKITRQDRDHENLSEALLLLSFINKKISGFSRGYLYYLNELLTDFRNSKKIPTAIYMLGNYYESRRDYDRAYSAYIDISQRFPLSPESIFARRRLAGIDKYDPRKVGYMPNKRTIRKSDNIDIKPEIDNNGNAKDDAQIVYSVSLGPFSDMNRAEKIRDLINGDFNPIKIVETRRKKFVLYVGRLSNSDIAISMKIRLAEEFGMNGNIVRIIKDEKRLYIYED